MAKSRALGTTLNVNGKAIGGLKSINGVEITADTIDLTTMDNQDGYRQKEPGLKDAGEVPVAGYLDGANEGQDEMYNLIQSGDIVPCSIVFPPKIGKTWSFDAGVSRFMTGAEMEDGVAFEATLLITGKPTLAASATV